MRIIGIKRDRKKSFFRAGMTLFLLCMVLSIASAQLTPAITPTPTPTPMSDTAAGVAVGVILAAFVLLVILGYLAVERGRLDMGEMRRAIAGTFVVGFTILLILSLRYNIKQTEIIMAYIELVGIVIGFYFGAKTATEKRAEAAAKITIEHIRFPAKKIAITIRNGGDSESKVDKIYINEDAFDMDVKIDPHKSREIEQAYEWAFKTEYKIKIATTTGLTDEITASSPKEKTAEPEK